jgi:inner membrane protein
MFVFGHIGITLGAAVLVSGLVTEVRSAAAKNRAAGRPRQSSPGQARETRNSFFLKKWFDSLDNFIDIRLLIIGSLLPDIIDKPLGFILYGNGRIITHTLLLTLIVLIIGTLLYFNRKKSWLLALAIGMASHLILDQMWFNPYVLLWPSRGWSFPRMPKTNWIVEWTSELRTNYWVDIPEMVGLAIVVTFLVILIYNRELLSFLKKGIGRKTVGHQL